MHNIICSRVLYCVRFSFFVRAFTHTHTHAFVTGALAQARLCTEHDAADDVRGGSLIEVACSPCAMRGHRCRSPRVAPAKPMRRPECDYVRICAVFFVCLVKFTESNFFHARVHEMLLTKSCGAPGVKNACMFCGFGVGFVFSGHYFNVRCRWRHIVTI